MELALVRLFLVAFFACFLVFGVQMFRNAREYAAARWGDSPPVLPQVFGYGLCLFPIGIGAAGIVWLIATIIAHPSRP